MADLSLQRGDVVIATFGGDYGKPRPGIVVQSNLFNEQHPSVILCPVSPELTGFTLLRLPVSKSETTGLRKDSEVMIDKVTAVTRSRIRQRIGRLSRAQMSSLDDGLRLWLNLPPS